MRTPNAAPALLGKLVAIGLATLLPVTALSAQDSYEPKSKAEPIDLDNTDVITAHVGTPSPAGGPVDDACRAAAAASDGGKGGTIVVCSHGGDGLSQRVPASPSIENSTRTGALYPPDVSGIPGCLGPCITIPIGHVPTPVYYIDLKSIPQAPKGTDAWKISKGEQRAP